MVGMILAVNSLSQQYPIERHPNDMWLFFTAVLVCATAIYLARTVGPPRLEILIAPKVPPSNDPASTADIPQPPLEVMLFCAQESEPHAREVMLSRAHKAYAELKDWDAVLRVLQTQEQEAE